MINHINCPNCGAPREHNKMNCSYCGTYYNDNIYNTGASDSAFFNTGASDSAFFFTDIDAIHFMKISAPFPIVDKH